MRTARALILLLIFSASCVKNRPYRIEYRPDHTRQIELTRYEKLTKHEIDCCLDANTVHSYRLAFAEFDDRGEMFDRAQIEQILGEIREVKRRAAQLAKAGREMNPPRSVNPAVIALFVHGWKNNASEHSGNVWGFRRLLAGLSNQYFDPEKENAPPDKDCQAPVPHKDCVPPAPVLGIYLGWRGAVVSAPFLKEFTFWDRKMKSQTLPNAHIVEALQNIMREAKGPGFTEPTISMLVGHSFGAAVLETALTQTLEGVIVQTRPGDDIRWPADLVVFINEAAQATQSYQLIESMLTNVELRKDCGEGGVSDRRMPVIVSLSSKGDYATRAVFPLVQSLSRPFNSLRHYQTPNALGLTSQLPMFLNTTSHLKNFQSHLFDRHDAREITEATGSGCVDLVTAILPEGENEITYKVVERPGALNRTPYWATHIPASIVPDHSSIFGSRFAKLLISFLKSQPLAPPVYMRCLPLARLKSIEIEAESAAPIRRCISLTGSDFPGVKDIEARVATEAAQPAWLSATPATPSPIPANIIVRIDPSGLASGAHKATISIRARGANTSVPESIPVTLTVKP